MAENIQRETPRRVRVGIDVGGTFTDVAVIDHETHEVVAQLKVPTTHDAVEGVARGIMEAIERVLAELNVQPRDVIFIAHSTTQATNALLEGDVAQVGIIGIGKGLEGLKASFDTNIPPIELAPGRILQAEHRYLSTPAINEQVLVNLLRDFSQKGVEVVVASEAFGVDNTRNEDYVCAVARQNGFLATAGNQVASLYGLRTRTRTATLNAAILPKMIHTAVMTESCVKKSGINAPLMIMRSDGGVMSVAEVHRRPIQTMLSGPAAGIAGALMHERISDGIFIEVGGTSADISVIRDGQPQTKAARVGGHRTFLQTLDVRTLAIAGGSMVRVRSGKIIDVGPRSAHIAGLGYVAFAPDNVVTEKATLVQLQPTPKDADDYIAIECENGTRYALTPTCAANVLGVIPAGAFAYGNSSSARAGFAVLAEKLNLSIEEAAKCVLDISCRKVAKQIEQLIVEYKLERATVELVGGGGAAALVLYSGKMMGLKSRLARQAEVISTIGVALAMVRDTIERNIVDPTPEDILQVRREATEAVVKAGALPNTVEVTVEVDTRRNLVKATAFGTTELKQGNSGVKAIGLEGCLQSAATSLQVPPETVRLIAETSSFYVFASDKIVKSFWGLVSKSRQHLRVTDHSGVVLLQRSQAETKATTVANAEDELAVMFNTLTDFGDAGRALPDIHLLVGGRIINLSGLAEMEQAIALAQAEFEHFQPQEPLVIIATGN